MGVTGGSCLYGALEQCRAVQLGCAQDVEFPFHPSPARKDSTSGASGFCLLILLQRSTGPQLLCEALSNGRDSVSGRSAACWRP